MPTNAATEERLARLVEAGQAPWLDSITRSWLDSGELEHLRRRFALHGVTSNPSIFQAALEAADYDADIRALVAEGLDDRAIYHRVATDDVRRACDVLAATHDAAGDGFVSIEVDPDLAFDADATIDQAHELWRTVHRPNLMVKVPATDECIPVVERLVADGINVNVTLLFDVRVYREVREAWLRGLLERLDAGAPVDDVHSVASFFVSRVDTMTDALLDASDDPRAGSLRGRAAVANALLAWEDARSLVKDPRWTRLVTAGAHPQRLLWASTGVKDPTYPATKYVDELVADGTVNTMPLATLEAFAATGSVERPMSTSRIADARSVVVDLSAVGIHLDEVTSRLRADGVDAFARSLEGLLESIARRR